ncbi:sporulation histidine kinase inhibitor Sda [Paenibacillus sp. J5C_2022]|nr:sporulation histidine kinase inhibitor Sda [Paenibacillus sp. J5C2022]MCU6709824.1 sporulation histidine kinase inhibitor Sda [Paenibacillus sp. J5C2022]
MDQLSDKLLIDTYYAAIEYKLEAEFIRMLAFEMKRRGLEAKDQRHSA